MRAIDRAVKKCETQAALAEKIGVTQALISQWVNGHTAIDIAHFQNISDATGGDVTPEELLADELSKLQSSRPAPKSRRTA